VRHTAPKRILGLAIPMPSYKDQEATSRLLAEIEERALGTSRRYDEQLRAVLQLRQSLLAKAFAGELS
jgi:hypothetical protein